MKLQMSFGENLINLRKQKGWSQDDLANNLNLSRQAISKWENDTSKPDIDNIEKISKIFSVTIDDLLNNDVVKDKAVTLNVKKEEKRAKAINIIKCMIIAVIILYIINVIFKFASLLIIVNGIQKYANLSNYHYVIKTYDNGLAEKEECWFKDGICKTVTTKISENKELNVQSEYIDFNRNYGEIENNEQKEKINVNEYLKAHLSYDIGGQLYLTIPIELRKKGLIFWYNESWNFEISENNEKITLKLYNKIIELDKNTLLPLLVYDYNIGEKNYSVKYYYFELNKVDEIKPG